MEKSSASRAVHRFIMDIQEKDKACSLCHTTFETRPQFLLHKLSPFHLKKLKASLLWDDFIVMCLACNISISDHKQAQLHIGLPEHKDKLKFWRKESKCTEFICENCGLSFQTVAGLEIHQTLPPHELVISSSNSPNLFKLVMDLGGMPPSLPQFSFNTFCKVCNEEYGRLDEFVSHLFSKLHIQQLRGSLCIVCSKNFIHASDRESHLGSYKHVPQIPTSNQELLETARSIISSRKNGYICMHCMIWCNSWPCFELHLLHSPHYEAILRREAGRPSGSVLTMNMQEENKCSPCKELSAVDWRRWIEEPAGLSGWCHSCGITLISPDQVESHLEDHYFRKICQAGQAGKLHPPVPITDIESTEVFSCFICSVSFKSEFFLVVHEALFQHHSRIATDSSNEHHYWCTKCGMIAMGIKNVQLTISSEGLQASRMSSESMHDIKQFALAIPEMCKSGASFISCQNSELLQPKDKSKVGGESNRSSSYRENGVNLHMNSNSCEGGAEFLGRNSEILFHKPENQVTDSFTASKIKKIERKDFLDNSNSNTSLVLKTGDIERKDFVNNSNTSISSNEYDQGQGMHEKIEKCAGQSDIDILHWKPDPIVHDIESKDNIQPNAPSLLTSQCHESSGSLAECSESLHHAGIGVPIVAAAMFSASETLNEALKSVATVVINTLSATLPVLQCSSASSLKSCTTHECEVGDVPERENKRRCVETTMGLEVALQQGLQSLIAGSGVLPHTCVGSSMQVSCDMRTCNHRDQNKCIINSSLQHDSNACMISNSNATMDCKASFDEPVNGSVKSSLSCMAQNCQHVASVVVAAGIVPHSTFAATGTADYASCDVNEVSETGS